MKIGFLVNPIAGMGGVVALKGTDNLAEKAIKLGATPIAPIRALKFIEKLLGIEKALLENIMFYIPQGVMGHEIFKNFNINYEILTTEIQKINTNSSDTANVVQELLQKSVDLIIFVGGDGTSIDIINIFNKKNRIPILGIPSGVKTYGAVFSHTPEEAVLILEAFFRNRLTKEAEILDLDEDQYRDGVIDVKLHGYAKVPAFPEYFQNSKERIEITEIEKDNLQRITEEIYDQLADLPDSTLLIIGPGSTFELLAKKLNIRISILGVDCILKRSPAKYENIGLDLREGEIFNFISKYKNKKLLITPIGGLGYLFGRGNHQISSRVLEKLDKEKDIIIACTTQKLLSIKDGVFRIDTNDTEINNQYSGFVKVIVDYKEMKMIKLIH